MCGLGAMLHVKLIGTPRIEDSASDVGEVRGQKPWAVLAWVLLTDRALNRRELSAELFPDADDPLGSLRWCLAKLPRAFGLSELFIGDPISRELPPSITVDVRAFWDGELDICAVGELLAGVDLPCGPEFSTWLLVARQQVAARIAALLGEATIAALSRGHNERAVELAELSARRSPFDEGAHVLLVKSLVMAGSRQAALEHVIEVETLFRKELGGDPSPALALRSAARASVAEEPPGVWTSALASTLLHAGRAAVAPGAIDAGLDCLRRAGTQAETSGDRAFFGQCLYELGSALVHSAWGFDDEGSLLLEQAALVARGAGDMPTAVASLRERGYADALAGRRPEAHKHLQPARELADADVALLAGGHAISAFNLADWGRFDEGIVEYQEAVELARRSADRGREAWALGLGGWALIASGQSRDAVSWLTRCLTLVRDDKWVSFEPWPVAVLAGANLGDQHDHPTARNAFEQCFAMSCQLDDPCWEVRVVALCAKTHLDNLLPRGIALLSSHR